MIASAFAFSRSKFLIIYYSGICHFMVMSFYDIVLFLYNAWHR